MKNMSEAEKMLQKTAMLLLMMTVSLFALGQHKTSSPPKSAPHQRRLRNIVRPELQRLRTLPHRAGNMDQTVEASGATWLVGSTERIPPVNNMAMHREASTEQIPQVNTVRQPMVNTAPMALATISAVRLRIANMATRLGISTATQPVANMAPPRITEAEATTTRTAGAKTEKARRTTT